MIHNSSLIPCSVAVLDSSYTYGIKYPLNRVGGEQQLRVAAQCLGFAFLFSVHRKSVVGLFLRIKNVLDAVKLLIL